MIIRFNSINNKGKIKSEINNISFAFIKILHLVILFVRSNYEKINHTQNLGNKEICIFL